MMNSLVFTNLNDFHTYIEILKYKFVIYVYNYILTNANSNKEF